MALRSGTEMPDLSGVTEWLNGEPDWQKLKSGPTLVTFWAISCHICHNNMPATREWKAKYEPLGLQFVSVHFPRQPEDTNPDDVRKEVVKYGITEPCGIDNHHKVADSFENEWVPAYFLFDAEGKLKFRAAGEYGLKMLQTALEKMFEA